MNIKKALYGLKTSGAAWRSLLASSLTELGYESTKADRDVGICTAVKPDGFEYYEMVLVYVYDISVTAFDPKLTMDAIGKLYRLKEGSVGPPDRYLGANIKCVQLPDGTMAWSIGADEYVDNALATVKATLESEIERQGVQAFAERSLSGNGCFTGMQRGNDPTVPGGHWDSALGS